MRPDRSMLLAATAATLLAGCGFAGTPGVGVETINTNVIYHPPKHATASNTAQSGAPEQPGLLPMPTLAPLSSPTGSFPIITIPSSCPAASPLSEPATVATPDVSTTPAAGTYKWVGTGTFTQVVSGRSVTLPVSGLGKRALRNVNPFTDPVQSAPGAPQSLDFTYDTLEPGNQLLAPPYLDYFWQVKSNSENPEDPVAGLALTEVATADTGGTDQAVLFQPAQGLLMLPLHNGGVQPGQSWTSTAVDANAAQDAGAGVWQLSGTVAGHENVDACGMWVQAWLVHATVAYTPPGATTSSSTTLDYDVATQYGAIVVAEKNINGFWFNGVTFNGVSVKDGAVCPDALPSGSQWQPGSSAGKCSAP